MRRRRRPAAFVCLAVLGAVPFARTELVQSVLAILAVFVGVPLALVGLLDVVRSQDDRARAGDAPTAVERVALGREVVGPGADAAQEIAD